MKIIITIVMLLGVTSCVTIKAPDDLVSDTVKAGTDVYDTVRVKCLMMVHRLQNEFLHMSIESPLVKESGILVFNA